MKSNVLLKNQETDPWGEYECFDVSTGFKESIIKGAGTGRFIKQNVPQGHTLRKSKIYFDHYVPNVNCVIALKDIESIKKWLNFADMPGKPSNIEQINNFACTPFNSLSDKYTKYVYWWQPVCYFNHASGIDSNVFIDMILENGECFFEMKALRDIKESEELFIDYRNFKLPAWFKNYFSNLNLISTEKFGEVKSGKHIDDPYTIHKYLEHHNDYKYFINNFYLEHERKGVDFAISSFMGRLPAGGKVLDMGCCTGWHSNMFYEAGFEVTAIDSSEKYIAELDPKLNPIVGNFETLSFLKAFDGFILSWMLHHLHRDGILEALTKIFSSLKEDGWLYISTVEKNKDYRDEIGRLYTTFTESELVKLLAASGFKVCYVEKHSLNHYENSPMIGIVIHAQRTH